MIEPTVAQREESEPRVVAVAHDVEDDRLQLNAEARNHPAILSVSSALIDISVIACQTVSQI
jgi:hypothetical protein